MKILPISDLHLDINENPFTIIESLAPADVLVIAGDLCQSQLFSRCIRILCEKYPQVVYVPGNHDFYDSAFHPVIQTLHMPPDTRPSNYHLLYNTDVTIAGQRFVGTTLWFPLAPNLNLCWGFSDFTYIRMFNEWYESENDRARSFLTDNIRPGDYVITHHAPSKKSISPQYRGSSFNPFYYTPLDPLVSKTKARIWQHGHMHSPQDYMLGETRVLCNPYGYESRGEPHTFRSDLVIEL